MRPDDDDRLIADTQVLVVGAGPSGIALARKLRASGVRHLVVDRDQAAASWKAMPGSLRVVSPWWSNAIRWRDVLRYPPFAKIRCEQYGEYLTALVDSERLSVMEGCSVARIFRDESGRFVAETNRGRVHSQVVVSCCGYFPDPVGPLDPPTSDGSVPVIHSCAYPGIESVRRQAGERPVVIVGRRVSAGQLMVELVDAGVRVELSTRAPVEFRRDGWRGRLRDELYFVWEELLLALKPRLRLNSFPVMDGGRARQILESGLVARRPPIVRIAEGAVEFADGSSLLAGLVINATGYRPVWPDVAGSPPSLSADRLPTCRDWESDNVPGLFFLGLDNRRNYRSRTLRGIRRDAAALARLLSRRLRR